MNEAARQDAVFRALGNPARRGMMDMLRAGPMTTGDIVLAHPGLSRFAVMQHLGVLEEAGLVVSQKLGRVRMNFLNVVPLREAVRRWIGAYEELWADELLDLKSRLETGPTPKGPARGRDQSRTAARGRSRGVRARSSSRG
ncbi:MAG: helix-turn-helix transcriptional regulator [Planctomycetes bacterium]|nr:helix-turn-helix transcriptional regulator [Planctomycetota bacterium]